MLGVMYEIIQSPFTQKYVQDIKAIAVVQIEQCN